MNGAWLVPATALIALAFAARDARGARAPDGGFEVEAQELAWSELGARAFDLRWRLPRERGSNGPDLRREMVALAAARFEIAADAGEPYRTFGDLVRASAELEPKARRAWLDRLAQRAPQVFERWGEAFAELLQDDQLFGARWDPDEDLPRDGFLHVDAWNLAAEGAPWTELDVTPEAEQGACLVRADAATWKEVESDYRAYFDHVGVAYESLHPRRGTHYVGANPDGLPFWSYRLHARCDLPFPFGDYTMDVHILNHAEDGRLVCDVYSTSEDFHWLAGQDVFVPLAAADGAPVGMLVVRVYGFDLDGVPDAAKHRRAALRSALGNLRRSVEPVFHEREAARADEPRSEPDPGPDPGPGPEPEPELVPRARLFGGKG